MALDLVEKCTEPVNVPMVKRTKLGNNMRFLRLEAGISVRDMAKRLDVSRSYVSHVELGKRSISVQRLALFLEQCNQIDFD